MIDESAGVLYVATGQKFLAEAELSARSAKSCMPNVRIALASNVKSNAECFDFHIELADPQFSFIDKILALKQTPFKRTLFLDTDTFVLASITDAFNLLDRFDLAAAVEPARYLYPIPGVPQSFPELNTGVMLYRSGSELFGFIDDWHRMYHEEIERMKAVGQKAWHDQLSFTEAVFKSRLSFFVLPPEYNARVLLPQQVSGLVRIVHARLKDPRNNEANLAFINKTASSARLFNPNPRRIPEYLYATLMLFRILKRR